MVQSFIKVFKADSEMSLHKLEQIGPNLPIYHERGDFGKFQKNPLSVDQEIQVCLGLGQIRAKPAICPRRAFSWEILCASLFLPFLKI